MFSLTLQSKILGLRRFHHFLQSVFNYTLPCLIWTPLNLLHTLSITLSIDFGTTVAGFYVHVKNIQYPIIVIPSALLGGGNLFFFPAVKVNSLILSTVFFLFVELLNKEITMKTSCSQILKLCVSRHSFLDLVCVCSSLYISSSPASYSWRERRSVTWR